MKAGIKAEEFWNMSMREVDLAIQAYQWRFDREAELLAHFTASIMNMWTKSHIRGRDLYRPILSKEKVIDLEKKRKEFEETVKILGVNAIPIKKCGGKCG